jgi:hypothetical protein
LVCSSKRIGDRKLETLFQEKLEFTISLTNPKSPFHSATNYILIPNTQNPNTKQIAQAWIGRSDNMQIILAEKNLDILAQHIQDSDWDNVPKQISLNNRDELLQELVEAKEFFRKLIDEKFCAYQEI